MLCNAAATAADRVEGRAKVTGAVVCQVIFLYACHGLRSIFVIDAAAAWVRQRAQERVY
jgi:hypothetical protein